MAVSLAGSGQMRMAASAPTAAPCPRRRRGAGPAARWTPPARRAACRPGGRRTSATPPAGCCRRPFHAHAVAAHGLGRRGSTALSRFCTSTAARSGLCPANTRLMLAQPVESLLAVVEQAGSAVHLAFDDGGDGFLDHLGRSAGIAGAHVDDGRGDVRILRHGQARRDSTPASTMSSEITQAKTGRSMKNAPWRFNLCWSFLRREPAPWAWPAPPV